MRLNFILLAWIIGIAQIGALVCPITFRLLIICLVLSGGIGIAEWMQRIQLNYYLSIALFVLNAVIVFLIGQAYADRYLTQQLSYRETQSSITTVIVYVDHIAEKNQLESQRWQQGVWVLNRHSKAVLWRIQYPAQHHTQLQLGQYYQLTGRIIVHHGYAVKGVFNQESWLIQQKYMASFELMSWQQLAADTLTPQHLSFIQQQQQALARLRRYIESQRLALRQWLDQLQLPQGGLLLALLSADQSRLSDTTQMLFRRLGIMHLLAISGPHVLIFALLFCAVLKKGLALCWPRMFLYCPRPDLLLWPFVLCVWCYAAFVGFETPALRTVLTVSVLGLLLIIKQRCASLQILLLSASILLLFDPLNILTAAFWLSYISSLILLRIYWGQGHTVQVEAVQSVIWRVFQQINLFVISQWKIFIALLPLMLWIFQQFSILAPLANCIAVPILGAVVVPLAMIASSLHQFVPNLAVALLYLLNWILEGLLWGLQYLDQITTNALITPALSPLEITMLSVAIGLVLFFPHGLWIRVYWLCCAIACMYTPQAKVKFELTVIDVGQGQALLLKLDQHHLMIDLGGSYNESQWGIGEHVISPFLLGQGITQLDQVIISHLDQDHWGGLSSLSKRIQIQSFLSNQYDRGFIQAGYADVPFQYCQQGQRWQYADARIEILAPQKKQLDDVAEHKNDRSCIVYVEVPSAVGYKSFLIMGDAGWLTEYQIMQEYPELNVDVLLIGHHGSRHSSAYDFLKWLKPKLAVVSVGKNNRYGHPHPHVLARLQDLSIPLKQTQHEGSMRFYLDRHQQMQLELYRDQYRWLR
ncbi:DNA internalization-related competence protein ComEC/Rec2 [Acinetobacter rudis]|uniref:DNA internalization-related competence protein ComEC/Rec2 n=1 Tax=Acinetobacter rudis TaxID=632955 RepID=UPI00280F14C4|nr:DNA internalization-related competence protein ComEC/Rec2 [Acinetobacter rudis]MDQ8951423.1 DNA internalization-related competence protein ComEC/Rec2 [Acinetobacter rudis]